ncbi:MAG: hypothetical protein ACREQY_01380 [Candidatus Binatia bacterium]
MTIAGTAELVVQGLRMPIYLVRWPDLSAALVKAGSEDELIEILDEVANPDGCTWSIYRGPLFLEFSLPARFEVKERNGRTGPIPPQDIVVEDVSGLREGASLEVEIGGADTGAEMSEAIEKSAFPHVFAARHGRDEDPTDEELRAAVRAELETLVRASWRREHVERRDDPESRLAAEMDAPVRLARRWMEAAGREPPPKPKGGRRKRRRPQGAT